MTESPSSALVREVVAVADRQRRRQAAGRALADLIPRAAAGLLLVGVVGHALGWSWMVTVAVAVAIALAFTAWAIATTRPAPATDAAAAAVDADASLGGELRSAYWFASASDGGDWAAFHVERAADRAQGVSWRVVYPPVRARRAWLGAAALTVLAFALPVGMPTGPWASASAPTAAELLAEISDFEGLPADLKEQVMALLAAVRDGQMTNEEALAKLRQLADFSRVDPERQKQLAGLFESMAPERDRLERAAASLMAEAGAMTRDVEWARENMASRLASEEAQRQDDGTPAAGEESSEPRESGPPMDQAGEGETRESSEGQAGARVPVKTADAGDGAQGMMLSSSNSSEGEPGSVQSGKRGNIKYGTSATNDMTTALKKEFIEANVNIDRSNLDNEDRRRKTQQSWSSLTYTRASGRASFDRVRSTAVTAVPEARRPVVERYFVSRATADETAAPLPAVRD